MKRRLVVCKTGFLAVFSLFIFFYTLAAQAQNVGGCGWGSKLFEGHRGIVPQILAVTTNGTSGNQTFAISSGTSGCTQDGVVRSEWRTAAFIDANIDRLASDSAKGQGESIDNLAALLNLPAEDRDLFGRVIQRNFDRVFPSQEISSQQVAAVLWKVMREDKRLAPYAP